MPDAGAAPAKGHNTAVEATQLRSIIERIERLEENKAAILADLSEVYAEAKAEGFDTKTLRKMVALRKKSAADRQAELFMFDLYIDALGMR